MTEFMDLARTFGWPIALVAFVMWRDVRRELAQEQRYIAMETWVRGEMATQNRVVTEALQHNSRALEANTAAMTRFTDRMDR